MLSKVTWFSPFFCLSPLFLFFSPLFLFMNLPHSCCIMTFHICVIEFFRPAFHKVGKGRAGVGQICLPRPSARALLSCRRQNCKIIQNKLPLDLLA
jgi:hypothetical protein